MNEKTLQKFKEKLKREKDNLEKELSGFARKDLNSANNWQTKYPKFGVGLGSQGLEETADEVEEYMSLLPIEANLETRLLDISLALEKIGKGKYGICEKCKKTIGIARLKIFPEAKTCQKCKK